ncbi:MAG: hypothetical protein EZS28_007776 [Streblomastix strix]|uniref:Uncharacterized protein n=1 Tax=Streblomastix strix TaxID=222440 RepID=A0A5J4WNN5_9EUKA|nr:MAG: hypothetical protein EZS28_007776 [Streblomastix strix]
MQTLKLIPNFEYNRINPKAETNQLSQSQQYSYHSLLHLPASSILFSPDGTVLLAGYINGSIRAWDYEEGTLCGFEQGNDDNEDDNEDEDEQQMNLKKDNNDTKINNTRKDKHEKNTLKQNNEHKSTPFHYQKQGIYMDHSREDIQILQQQLSTTTQSSLSAQPQSQSQQSSSLNQIQAISSYSPITSLVFSCDCEMLGSGDENGLICVWETSSGRCGRCFSGFQSKTKVQSSQQTSSSIITSSQSSSSFGIRRLLFSRDGSLLLCVCNHLDSVFLLNLRTGKKARVFSSGSSSHSSSSSSPLISNSLNQSKQSQQSYDVIILDAYFMHKQRECVGRRGEIQIWDSERNDDDSYQEGNDIEIKKEIEGEKDKKEGLNDKKKRKREEEQDMDVDIQEQENEIIKDNRKRRRQE